MTDRMHTVEEARAAVLARVRPLRVERIPLTDAVGRVLAEPVSAPGDRPPLDNSARDGFAMLFDDVVSNA